MLQDEEVWAECSDDEKYNPGKLKAGTWQPRPEDILRLYEEISANKVLPLSWVCPGRRPPEAELTVEEEPQVTIETEHKDEEKKPVEPNEFDFDDGPQTKTVLTPRRTPGSAPRAEKRVARMDKVLKDMMYQRKLQAAEREARRLAKSPRAPASPGRARLGSPAGSPRTTPTANRQSPIRLQSTADPATTPLRAPVHTTEHHAHTPVADLATTPLRAPIHTTEHLAHTPVADLAANSNPAGEMTPPANKPREVSQPVTPVGITARVESPVLQTADRPSPPGEVMAVGSQGSGETTTSVPSSNTCQQSEPSRHREHGDMPSTVPGPVTGSGPSTATVPAGEPVSESTTSQGDTMTDVVTRKLDAMDTS